MCEIIVKLSDKQMQLIKYVLLDHYNKEIADFLGLSFDQFKDMHRLLLQMLGQRGKNSLTAWALTNGFTVDQVLKKVWYNGKEI